MAVVFKACDLFTVECDALVNTVNTVGVMGKGVALKVKHLSKENFARYKRWCESDLDLRGGDVFVCEPKDYDKGIFNVATKEHWRNPSKLVWVERGLFTLRNYLEDFPDLRKFKTIALPPLGCGNGGLDKRDVFPLIEKYLGNIEGYNFIVCY